MMTQSVMTQSVNLFGHSAGTVAFRGKQVVNGFDLIMGSSMKALNSFGAEDTAKNAPVPAQKANSDLTGQSDEAKDEIQKPDVQQADTQKTDATGMAENAAVRRTDNTKAENTSQIGKTAGSKDGEETEDSAAQQLLALISAMLQTVSDTIMDRLNVSQEEFQQLLDDLSMTVSDLLEPGNLQAFVLAANGEEDALSLLTNEELADMMKDLMQQVEDIIADADIGMTSDQIREFLEKAEAAIADTSQDIVTEAVDKPAENPNGAKAPEAAQQTDADKTVHNQSHTEAGTAVSKDGIGLDEELTESHRESHDNSEGDNQTDLKAADSFQTFVDNLVKATKDTTVQFSESMTQTVDIREIANQILERIRITVTPDQSFMELQLQPESLGKVNLSVQSKNGVMTAQFTVQNEICKEAIEGQLNALKETLSQQGIKVEVIEVTVSANYFDQSSNEGTQNQPDEKKNGSGKHITLEEAMNMTELPDGESNLQSLTETLGSQIDYTA